MKHKRIGTGPDVYALIYDAGDEVVASLQAFAEELSLSASSLKAIGALSSVKLGWYNPETKEYDVAVDLREQIELLSLVGDVGQMDGKPVLHLHAVIGRQDGTTMGGHVLHAVVHPTCEMFLIEYEGTLLKRHDAASNLNLFSI